MRMSPRTLSATGKNRFKSIAKKEREAQAMANRDRAQFAVVEFGSLVFVRPLVRAKHLIEKHPEANIVSRFSPEEE